MNTVFIFSKLDFETLRCCSFILSGLFWSLPELQSGGGMPCFSFAKIAVSQKLGLHWGHFGQICGGSCQCMVDFAFHVLFVELSKGWLMKLILQNPSLQQAQIVRWTTRWNQSNMYMKTYGRRTWSLSSDLHGDTRKKLFGLWSRCPECPSNTYIWNETSPKWISKTLFGSRHVIDFAGWKCNSKGSTAGLVRDSAHPQPITLAIGDGANVPLAVSIWDQGCSGTLRPTWCAKS